MTEVKVGFDPQIGKAGADASQGRSVRHLVWFVDPCSIRVGWPVQSPKATTNPDCEPGSAPQTQRNRQFLVMLTRSHGGHGPLKTPAVCGSSQSLRQIHDRSKCAAFFAERQREHGRR